LNYAIFVKLTVQVQLQANPDQRRGLLATMHAANAACDRLSTRAWDASVFGQFAIHKLAYHACRKEFPALSSQVVVRCISKVADAYKLDRERQRTFRPNGAISYDARILSWKIDASAVSIWTVDGRQSIPFVCGEKQRELLKFDRGEADLVHRDGRFYLLVCVDLPDVEEKAIDGFIGIDLGIAHLATDSDGMHYGNPKIDEARTRRASHRRRLGKAIGARQRKKKRVQSIHRAIARHRGRERLFRTDVNHVVSKQIVAKAQCTGRGIAVEELTGIRTRTEKRLKRTQRSRHGSWAFSQLRLFLTYKAALAGVTLTAVDPRNTSRTCAECGHCEKLNRQSQDKFKCRSCGHTAQADHNAARNIGRRASVSTPMVTERQQHQLLSSTVTSPGL
jgi:IS605 OrfB family transposase